MRNIDKLLLKAKRLTTRQSVFLSVAFISKDTDVYKTKCQLWDGRPCGEVRELGANHVTLEEARAYVDMVAAKYPYKKKEPVIIEFVPASKVLDSEILMD